MTTKKVPALPDPSVTAFVSPIEAGEFLGIGRHAAYRAIRDGAIPSIKVGKLIRVPVAELRRMAAIDK